jgi:hypothetical protein
MLASLQAPLWSIGAGIGVLQPLTKADQKRRKYAPVAKSSVAVNPASAID